MEILGFLLVCFIIGYPFYWLFFKPKKKQTVKYKPRTLADFSGASDAEKREYFQEWCRRKGSTTNRRRSETQLEDYAFEYNLPLLADWKEINGYSRIEQVQRQVYTDWIKYIGAYNPKFDPDHQDWDGR